MVVHEIIRIIIYKKLQSLVFKYKWWKLIHLILMLYRWNLQFFLLTLSVLQLIPVDLSFQSVGYMHTFLYLETIEISCSIPSFSRLWDDIYIYAVQSRTTLTFVKSASTKDLWGILLLLVRWEWDSICFKTKYKSKLVKDKLEKNAIIP